jgi:hypothetical protein
MKYRFTPISESGDIDIAYNVNEYLLKHAKEYNIHRVRVPRGWKDNDEWHDHLDWWEGDEIDIVEFCDDCSYNIDPEENLLVVDEDDERIYDVYAILYD